MDFYAPLVVNPDDKELATSMMHGVKIIGQDTNLFNEKIEHLASDLGEDWAKAVRLTKEEIQTTMVEIL